MTPHAAALPNQVVTQMARAEAGADDGAIPASGQTPTATQSFEALETPKFVPLTVHGQNPLSPPIHRVGFECRRMAPHWTVQIITEGAKFVWSLSDDQLSAVLDHLNSLLRQPGADRTAIHRAACSIIEGTPSGWNQTAAGEIYRVTLDSTKTTY